MMVYWRKHVKMGDKFHRDEDNRIRQTPRHWRCDRTSSLMSMCITISRATLYLLRCHLIHSHMPGPRCVRVLLLIATFLKGCSKSGQIVISDLPFYIPLNYAVNVSSNTLWLRFYPLWRSHSAKRSDSCNSVNSFSKIQRILQRKCQKQNSK